MIWLDKNGWPVEFIMRRPITNMIRWLLHVSLWQTITKRGSWVRSGDGVRPWDEVIS